MATQIYVPGPAQIFTGTGAADALEFLGFTEGPVRLNDQAYFEPVMADLSGPRMFLDMQYMGMGSYASGELVRYDEAVLKKLEKRLKGATALYGSGDANSIGSLMLGEGYACQVVIKAAYGSKTVFSSGNMSPGRNYPKALFDGGIDKDISVRAKRPRFTVMGLPVFGTDGSWTLFNDTIPTLPSLG